MEKRYQEALSEMEAAKLVADLETVAQKLEAIAEKFDSLSGYKDSVKKAEECREYVRNKQVRHVLGRVGVRDGSRVAVRPLDGRTTIYAEITSLNEGVLTIGRHEMLYVLEEFDTRRLVNTYSKIESLRYADGEPQIYELFTYEFGHLGDYLLTIYIDDYLLGSRVLHTK